MPPARLIVGNARSRVWRVTRSQEEIQARGLGGTEEFSFSQLGISPKILVLETGPLMTKFSTLRYRSWNAHVYFQRSCALWHRKAVAKRGSASHHMLGRIA